jgi:thiosulfate dehydrogenase
MKGFVLGVLVTVLVGAAVVYIYFAKGFAPVATAAQAMPFEKTLARMALNARVEKEMPHQVPIQPDEASYTAGARIYVEHCGVCHGLPGKEQTAIAIGEFPKPPRLFEGKGVTDDEPGETYWKVANGIRMTGMPAFDKHLSTTEMWQVSLLLANADKLPASVMTILNSSEEPTGHPAGEAHEASPHTHTH